MLGSEKLVEALRSVTDLGPTLHRLVDEIQAMRETLLETNSALGAVREELVTTRGAIGEAAGNIDAAADRLETIATRAIEQG